jgi:iron complex outermembrane receptor protein
MKRSLTAGVIACAFAPAFAEDISTFDLGTIVVTPQRFDSPRLANAASISVITQKDIQRSPATTLPELLSGLAGIHTRNNSGSPDSQIDMRGFGITGNQNVVVLLDGQRINEIELVSPDWSAVPLDAIERIEIVRGSGAVLYGPGATGGTINIITKSPAFGQRAGFIGASYGNLDTSELRAGGQVGGENVGASLYANQFHSDNYRENNAVRQKNAEAELRATGLGGNWIMKLGADDQNLRLPGARTEAQLETDRRGTNTPNDYSTRTGDHIELTNITPFGRGEFTTDLSYRDRKATAYFATYDFRSDTAVHALDVSPRVKVRHNLFGRNNELIAGFDWDDWDYDNKDNFGDHTRASQRDQAVYLQNQTMLGADTRLSIGGRIHRVENTLSDYLSDKQQSRTPHAYEIALRHNFSTAFSGYAKVGRSFRIAVVDENLGQVSLLEPQTSSDRELGLDAKFGAFDLGASAYQMELTNEIGFLPSTLFPPFGANINLPPTRRQGLELRAAWRALPTLSISANYTYTDAEFRSGTFNSVDVTGKTIPLVPKDSANLSATWRLAPHTRLSADAQYVGAQYFDNDQANTFGRKMPAYTIVNAKLAHDIGAWRLAAAVKNLFNEKYFSYGIASGTTFNAYPEPERTFLVSAEYHFK